MPLTEVTKENQGWCELKLDRHEVNGCQKYGGSCRRVGENMTHFKDVLDMEN